MECTGPAVVKGEGLSEGLANDVACLIGIKEFVIKRNDLDCKGGALGRELGIEGFQMKEDCLFGLEHLFCALAGNGDENEMCWFHIDRIFIKDNFRQFRCQFLSIRGYILLVWKNALGALATKTKYVVISGQNKNYNNVCNSFK